MELSLNIIEILGFFLVLSGAALILVRTAMALSHGGIKRMRLAIEMVLILSIIYVFIEPALTFAGWQEGIEQSSNAVAFLWFVAIAFLVNTILNQVLWQGILSDNGERRVPKLITDGLGLSLYALAIFLVLHYVYGEPIGAVLATSGAAAIIIGIGAQSTIHQVFSGVSLSATKALRVGDFVEIDNIYGEVVDINWRSVSLLNPNTDSLYIFPNSLVADKIILNFSEPTDTFRYYVTFSAELSAPPELVIRSIAQELENSIYVLRNPKPNFNIMGYSEKGMDYRIRYHFDGDDPWWDAQNEVCMAIWAAMRKHDLRISMNRMLQNSPDEWAYLDERIAKKIDIANLVGVIKQQETFKSLSEDEISTLCKSYASLDLSPPSCFYHYGDQSEGLYLLLEGEVGIFDNSEFDTQLKIATCRPGEMFGVSASINDGGHRYKAQALQHSIAIRLPQTNLSKLLRKKPKLLVALKEMVANQEQQREQARLVETKAHFLALHHQHRRSAVEEIRRGLDTMMYKPWFQHLFDHLSSSVRNEELVQSVMAGAALVTTARGVPDDAEKDFLMSSLRDADLFKHIDAGHAMELFDKYANLLTDEGASGEARVMTALSGSTRIKHGPKIVVGICKGLCGVHELPTQEELNALKKIAKTLNEDLTLPKLLDKIA